MLFDGAIRAGVGIGASKPRKSLGPRGTRLDIVLEVRRLKIGLS